MKKQKQNKGKKKTSSKPAGTPGDGGKTKKSAVKEVTLDDFKEENMKVNEEAKAAALNKKKSKPKPNSDVNVNVNGNGNGNGNVNVNGNGNGKHYLNNSLLRGLLPRESDEAFRMILKGPVLKRLCIEHCYFMRNRSGMFRYNLRRPTNDTTNTVPFENAKEIEQQTIDFECLGSEEINSASTNDSINGNIKVNGKKKRSSVSSCSGRSGVTEESAADDSNDRDYCPVKAFTGTDTENCSAASVESSESSKVVSSDSGTSKPIFKLLKNVPVEDRKKSRHRLEIKSYPSTNRTPNSFVSVHDLIAKIKDMQKLMKAKYERLGGVPGKAGKIPSIRVKKVSMTRGKGEDFPQMSEYLYPVANLGDGEKDWRVQYMDDDVQSFGLDDLLLKASELNAENFTKALGRKVDSVNSDDFNAKDSSEIVFTIPKSKRNSVDEKQSGENAESEFSTHANVKTVKLDISKPFLESGEAKEPEKSQEVTSKPPEESSPKRPGIKVKTVENINEEFKDSLSLKNKLLQENSLNGSGKELPPILETRRVLCANTFPKRVVLDKIESNASFVIDEKKKKGGEKSRPFIMTIVQSKSEKQRPAILRNSTYFRKKARSTENGPTDLERMDEGTNNEGEQMESSSGSGKTNESAKAASESHITSPRASERTNFNLNKGDGFVQSPSMSTRNFSNSSYGKALEEGEDEAKKGMDGLNDIFASKKRNIPFILSHNRNPCQGNTVANNQVMATSPTSKLVKINEGSEKLLGNEKTFKVTSIEQKVGPKEVHRRFIKVVPYEPVRQFVKRMETGAKALASSSEPQLRQTDEEGEKMVTKELKTGHVLSLSAFATILKDILPDKWFIFNDKKYGLQIVKTHVDEMLNPSILISVVIARCGKITVNVRGKQLRESHDLFSNLCEVVNSENKVSLNYVLALLNKLNFLSVCFGCEDQSLKKYWCKDGFIEYHTEFQQVYRSHKCQMLVSLGKKRCYSCYRMNESLKKRYRREKLDEKVKTESPKEPTNSKEMTEVEDAEHCSKAIVHPRGVKRNLEDFLEESFSTMKQHISNEIEKNKKLGERENAMKAQEEVLSFMGLARKDSVDNPVRKSKRKKTTFYSLQQPVKKTIDQKELEFLEKHWTDINTLFSTSLLFGAYSRTGRPRLREKCRMFQKLLSTWRNIARTNPEWLGGEITLPEDLFESTDPLADDSGSDQFEKMEVPALRTYIINSVKEVNRIKYKLRTRNSYFKILYNKFVKQKIKGSKLVSSSSSKTTPASSANSATNTPTPTDVSSDESSRDKEKMSDDDSRPVTDLIMTCVPDGD